MKAWNTAGGNIGRRLRRSGWLALAASPAFALMALVEANASPSPLCMSAPGDLPSGGMVRMYLLMSLFHLSPWLRLAGGRPRKTGRSLIPNHGDRS